MCFDAPYEWQLSYSAGLCSQHTESHKPFGTYSPSRNMPLIASQTVVDLLSTDDETPGIPASSISQRSTKDKRASTGAKSRPAILESRFGLADAWSDTAAKRRKLSHSPPSQISTLSEKRTHSTTLLHRNSIIVEPTQPDCNVSELSDDITFTSSACLISGVEKGAKPTSDESLSGKSDDDLPEDIFAVSSSRSVLHVSGKTARFLEKIKQHELAAPKKSSSATRSLASKKTSGGKATVNGTTPDRISIEDEHPAVEQSRVKRAKKPKLTEEEKALKAQEKEAAKDARAAQKAKDKEVDKEKRKLEREEKAREKQRAADLAEVNKARKDRKETSKEMLVDLPISIEGERVEDQIKEFMKTQGISTTTYQSPVPNTIRWRRKVDSYFDEEKGHRVAMPKEIHDERHAICLMSAKDFVDLTITDHKQLGNDALAGHILKLKTNFVDYVIIYIIEGLDACLRKNKNARNRAYESAVLGQAQSVDDTVPTTSQSKARRKKQLDVPIDEDKIEDALLQLQVKEGCLVHHTATSFETAEWVANFTQHISQLPYR